LEESRTKRTRREEKHEIAKKCRRPRLLNENIPKANRRDRRPQIKKRARSLSRREGGGSITKRGLRYLSFKSQGRSEPSSSDTARKRAFNPSNAERPIGENRPLRGGVWRRLEEKSSTLKGKTFLKLSHRGRGSPQTPKKQRKPPRQKEEKTISHPPWLQKEKKDTRFSFDWELGSKSRTGEGFSRPI